ncbi:NUDIX hydrolase [Pelagicoccus albus]|uniref:NUDIX domain-containing protein n=1 Tax=Pelagicoccus albus TaxID=415222 RepID=A0A7X1B4U8_9BACT|nr:NUDIX domain-containing protein [Pelagicoccus albus]MBC2604558.1 NUDIX domain-containing protein [Pelagicoccus albus]
MADYQIGVFAVTSKDKPKIVLVTSRTGDRWIFPKGQPEKDRSKQKVAKDEAWEEAGLSGTIKSSPNEFKVSYGTTKNLIIYYMKVDKIHDSYPESKERKRTIVSIEEAEELLEKDLRKVLKAMAKKYL